MKNCHVCGAENADYARFCTRCGSPLEETVSARTEEDSDLFGPPAEAAPPAPSPSHSDLFTGPRADGPNVSPDPTPLPLSETEAAPRKAEAPSKNAEESLDEASFAVENVTRITPQLFLKFYKWMKTLGIVFCILGALALVLYIVSFFTYDEYGNPAPDDSALLAACVLIACGVMLIIVRAVYTKNAKITENTRQIVRFGERAVHIFDFEGDRPFSQAHILYERITRVRQTKEFLILYLGNVAYIMDRGGFTAGSEAELKNLLTYKCPPGTVGMKN